MKRAFALSVALLASLVSATTARAAAPPEPVPIDISRHFDNDGIDTAQIRDGDFDGDGHTFPSEELPTGPITVDGLPHLFPAHQGKNNVVALGQRVDLPKGHYFSAHFLVASSWDGASGTATVHYADGTTTTALLGSADWYSGSGSVKASYRYTRTGIDHHPVSISTAQVWADPKREAVAITLPVTQPAEAGKSALHVFALTMQPVAHGKALVVRGARSTNKLPAKGTQSVEATVVNLGDEWITNVAVGVNAPGAITISPAMITRLAPGEETRVRIGIRSTKQSTVEGTVFALAAGVKAAQRAKLTLGTPDYLATDASLGTHESPYWFDDAKFGIFIHWGLYSVPAWSPPGKQYAEWYWQWMQNPKNAVYDYHAKTYGKDFAYDQFIPQFTADKFDPRAWVELFQQAGARYYVLTSKHHEGFALWDSKVSGRDSVDLGPKRDLVKELFDASRKYTPSLRNGLYFSMPEWFNPDQPWKGHAPRNPYTGAPEPYTGYQSGRDFVKDYQGPQMTELVDGYDPDVIWCDIGGANDSRRVMADYFNKAKNRPRPKDVTVDDRCGIPTHDYTTPEYATYPNTVVKKWEASRGLDPRSYGWNRATPDSMYMTADEVVDTLVDTTSKNGNFLLDIGPRADGTIPEIMQQRLRETGAWLRTNGESIYGTTYWPTMAQLGDLRFAVKPNDAFYITSLKRPGSRLVVDAPVPIRKGDEVTLLGHDGPLKWRQDAGKLVIDVPDNTLQHAWVFRIGLS
ncbi:alpha-L-fucosidase [Lentzea sp. NBRC 105346]|uniref:alpha-L-fucosidase n=1 Tax=Lentzea sp. NBRC 105346 TaxID=3032205 RepID=UPI0024A15857|nr:alpha-L-fucosidase [Lentzea sp. NBRC 105346]GLZ29930.1 alpha-L-fucosidase [Lentzea sp. NBRC 105346]